MDGQTPPEPLDSFISDTEECLGSFRSPDGVTRIESGDRADVEQVVVTAVTDERILFTTAGADGSGDVSLSYDEIVSISEAEDGLIVQTSDGIGIEWSLSAGGPDLPVRRHLCWVGELRSRIRSCQNDVELAAGEIRTLADERSWEEAKGSYHEIRGRLDDLCNDVFCTTVIENDVLAPELTGIERTLETAHTRLFIERGESQLELARQLLENGDYEQGRKVLAQAQQSHRRAKRQRDAVKRGDAFQFGTQRTLTEDIRSLGWKIETAAAEPIRQAHEAKVKAQSADDSRKAVSRWERAFRRYGLVLTLEWGGEKRNLVGEPERIRRELDGAATRLIELHGQLADRCWNDGATHQADGESKAALEYCLDAQRHLERAHELASEFRPDRIDRIESRLETMADEVMRMRHGELERADHESEARAVDDDRPRTAGAGDEPVDRPLPTADELAEIDTHHDITLDSVDLQGDRAETGDSPVSAHGDGTTPTSTEAEDPEADPSAGELNDGETTSH